MNTHPDNSPSPPVDVAVGVLIEPQKGRPHLLITRRTARQVLGGYWELPGGKVEAGESLADCARREFLEEVGLTVEPLREIGAVEHTYPHGHIRLHAWLCRRISGTPANLHVAEHRWVTLEELPGYPFPPANLPLMDAIRRELGPG